MRGELFRSVVLKPNEEEAEAACRRRFGMLDLKRLYTECKLRSLIVTHGERGVEVIDGDACHWVNGRRVQAVDICGAGDSFSAGAACALAITQSAISAACFGNLVASITVTKKGTGTASPDEVLTASQAIP
jgi:sugar/nucleoside kinase (ribokinase family)